ncbi:peptidoglycan-binding domain-containing protein, partial [Frankia sp. Cr2]|uniref:peptidoglycan-binding domain-containing protein n=1 Tax=Frankia sp. Cr2 TaxID=3073932 RepID=UPI002AD4C468
MGSDVAVLHAELSRLGLNDFADDLRGVRFGAATRRAVMLFQEAAGLDTTGVVDVRTSDALSAAVDRRRPRMVRGQVQTLNGDPVPGVVVGAVDRGMSGERPLGETTTDAHGRYEIAYAMVDGADEAKTSADLVLRVRTAGGDRLVESAVVFSADREIAVDLRLPDDERAPSEFELLRLRLDAALGSRSLPDLTVAELDYLAGVTNIPRESLVRLAASEQIGYETGLPPALFYGLSRDDARPDIDALLARDATTLRHALNAAVRDRVVPASLGADGSTLIDDQLTELQVDAVVRAAPTGAPASLGDLVGTVVADESRCRAFGRLAVAHRGSDERLWAALRENADFPDAGER